MRYCEIVQEAPRKKAEPFREPTAPVIDTPEFRAWFGSSKVVHPDGSPVVCVHATATAIPPEFVVAKQRFGMGGYGFYFTTAAGANRYSEYHDKFMAMYMWDGTPKQPNQIPVFLRIENPLVVDNIEDLKRHLERGQTFGAVRGQQDNIGPDTLTKIQQMGYDGVMTWETLAPKTTRKGLAHLEPGDPKGVRHPVFIVFEPGQIKSIFNRGTFDPNSPNIMEAHLDEALDARQMKILRLIRGVRAGKLLVHVRVKDGTDFRHGIHPSAGEFLRSTEMWQSAEEEHGQGPELIFFADDFAWLKASTLATVRGQDPANLQAVFVRKNPSIVQDVGDGKVKTSSGQIIRYEMSEVADYDDPVYRDIPAGVETGDWFTRESQEVVAAVDVADILAVLKD